MADFVIEVAWAAVDALSGAFAFALPIEAPVRATYLGIAPFSLGYAIDAGAAGKYTLEAASGGSTKVQPIDAASPVPAVSFVFP